MIRNYSYTKIKRKIILLIRRKLAMKQNKGKYEKAIIRCNGKKKSFTQFCLLKANKTLRGNSQRKECHSRTQTVFIELIGNWNILSEINNIKNINLDLHCFHSHSSRFDGMQISIKDFLWWKGSVIFRVVHWEIRAECKIVNLPVLKRVQNIIK